MDALMNRRYYDPALVGSYGGVDELSKAVKLTVPCATKDDALKFLRGEDTYTLHKPLRKNFKRNRVVSWGKDYLWQADLVDVSSLSKDNDNNKFILTIIDVLSKYAWAKAIKNKQATTVLNAFKQILKEGRKPNKLNCDSGSEFLNKKMEAFLKQNNIIFYTSKSEKKCPVIERWNKTLKTRMWRYFTHRNTRKYTDVLHHLVKSYNQTKHKTIGLRPCDVTSENDAEVRERVYGTSLLLPLRQPVKYKFSVGDTVRISKLKLTFEKSYLPNWSEEIFTVSECVPRDPPVYRIKDSQNEEIRGTFYTEELQKVTTTPDKLYVINEVLNHRKYKGEAQILVNWRGYPKKVTHWIPASEIVKL
jgi:hypothetical protein